MANPHLGGENFLLHERFLRLVKAMIPGGLIHFGDASIFIGFQAGLVFHKDNPDRHNGNGPDWRHTALSGSDSTCGTTANIRRTGATVADMGIGLIDMPEQTREVDFSSPNLGYVPLPDD